MSTTRCFFCGRYGKDMVDNKCRDCVREYREVRESLSSREAKEVHYVDNVLAFKMVAK